VIGPRSHPDHELREKLLLASILEARPDLVVLAGWLQLLPVPPELEGKVVNIHPALLPAYGGAGCYGERVHRAVAADRPPVSGCTVHFADAQYDCGPYILQEAVPVLPGDDAAALAARVFEVEKRVLPEALRLVLGGRAAWHPGGVVWS
ncbi:MAG TPA: formyltransferase family protein, partial [Planctomycetota bacterium]